ncbi:MAG TPA: hypothetical protein VMM85_00505 [Methylomirabilota bacterium]|nr:hypothetical protein [Methylomirabilota bacterium]
MTRRLALSLVIGSALAIGIAYASAFAPGGAPVWAAWLLAAGTATILIGITMLGALRPGRAGGGRLVAPFVLTWIVVFGGLALALALPAEATDGPIWLGLPRRAAIIVYGIGLLPFFLLPVAYARTFDDTTLSEADLTRVRDAAATLREAGGVE